MKYNHVHQSCFVHISYCDINIIYLLRSISHDLLCYGSGGRVHGVQNPLAPTQKLFFWWIVDERKRRNRREMFTFFTLLILVKLFKSKGVGILYFRPGGGGGWTVATPLLPWYWENFSFNRSHMLLCTGYFNWIHQVYVVGSP